MRFVSFIKELESEDKYLKSFITFVKRNKRFPLSSDPDLLFFYLRDRLNNDQKRGYMLAMLIYAEQPKNMIPKRYKDKTKLLEAVNRIVANDMRSEADQIPDELNDIDPGFTATYPQEHICFFAADLPTQEGDAHVFLWVDAYSGYVILTGVEKQFSDLLLLKHLRLFLDHHDFKMNYRNRPITFFFHKYGHLSPQINEILRPIGGTSKVSDPYVSKIVVPVLQDFFSSLAGGFGQD